jgi:hypothetical protein
MQIIKYLTTKQRRVLRDLFSGKIEEDEVLKKWHVTDQTYCRWHQQKNFAAEFDRRLKLSHQRSELVFANWTSSVAAKLVSLASAQKEETARKACMDIINHPDLKAKIQSQIKKLPEEEEPPLELPPELTGTLLSAIAVAKKCKTW